MEAGRVDRQAKREKLAMRLQGVGDGKVKLLGSLRLSYLPSSFPALLINMNLFHIPITLMGEC